MKRESSTVWSLLLEAGLVEGAEPVAGRVASPWYVGVMLAFFGWVAALFLLGFIGVVISSVIENSIASSVIGMALVGGAYHLLQRQKNEFYEHLSLALSLTGQMLVTWAIFKWCGEENSALFWLSTMLLQIVLAVVMPDFIHRLFSSFVAAICFAIALAAIGMFHLLGAISIFIASWLWLNEFYYPRHISKIQAGGYGVVLALVLLTSTTLYGYDPVAWGFVEAQTEVRVPPWLGEVLVGVVLLYVIWTVLQRSRQTFSQQRKTGILLGALLLAVISMSAPGITVGVTILILGVWGGNRILQGLGIVALLFYISSYYYLLDATLLTKAKTLFLVGSFLLALYGLMVRARSRAKGCQGA